MDKTKFVAEKANMSAFRERKMDMEQKMWK